MKRSVAPGATSGLSDEGEGAIARQIVAAKIQNSRNQLLRSARCASLMTQRRSQVAQRLADTLTRLRTMGA